VARVAPSAARRERIVTRRLTGCSRRRAPFPPSLLSGSRLLALELAGRAASLERGVLASLLGLLTQAEHRGLDSAHHETADQWPGALAHMIVGAAESLANWWLDRPEVRRDQVAEWYVEAVQAAVAAALRRNAVDRPS
jgi:hypothetical protein